jgi:adenylate cyclase
MHKINQPRLANLLLKVIYSSADSVVVTDARQPDNPIIFVNPAFERLTGYTQDEIIGRNCRFLQAADTDQPGRRQIRGAILMGTECRTVLRNYRKDGSIFYNELSITPVFDSQGRPQYFLGVQHEVPEPASGNNGK